MVKSKRPKPKSKSKAKPKIKRIVKRPKAKVKKSSGKTAKTKKPGSRLRGKAELSLEKIGEVTHYFPKVKAAAVMIMKDSLKIGDGIYLKGHTTDFKEKVVSMQLDHATIQEGRKGQEIGLFVKSRVRIGDNVYRL